MRVLLATYGSRGDVEPIVALAVELRSLDAEVVVCAPADNEFSELSARAGIRMAPFAKTWRSWAEGASTAQERVPSVDDFVRGYIDATFETMLEAAQGCDVLLATGMLHFVAGSVAEKLSIPHHFVMFCPILLEPQGWQSAAAEPINKNRESVGLPPITDVWPFLFTDRPWIAADNVLAPNAGHGTSDVFRTDAWIRKDERPLSADLVEFLDAGSPPVYVGFGSMRMQEESARVAVEAIRAQGRRVILARGWADLAPVDDREDVFGTADVNQQALFKKVAAVIHHGGAGTTTTAARAGVPQVIVPQAADQPYWADRIAALGVGAAHDGPTPSVGSLSASLEVALSAGATARANAVADDIRSDGASAAARHLIAAAQVERR